MVNSLTAVQVSSSEPGSWLVVRVSMSIKAGVDVEAGVALRVPRYVDTYIHEPAHAAAR